MSTWREGKDRELVRRMEAVMRVLLGQLSPTEVAQELHITREYVYRLEKKMLVGFYQALVPRRRGRKPILADPKLRQLEEKIAQLERQRDLVKLKTENLEGVNRSLVEYVHNHFGGKKGTRGRMGYSRAPVSHHLPAVDTGLRKTAGGNRSDGPGLLRGGGAGRGDVLPVEAKPQRRGQGSGP